MKKSRPVNRKRLIPIAVVAVAMALFAIIYGGIGIETGLVIKTESGVNMVYMDESPVVISDHTPKKKAFNKYSTGDKIILVTGAVRETWPAGADMHWCLKLDGGDYTDIPVDVINQLAELGYVVSDKG